mgnify:CR=1 FL=1|jgi:hypothetical protein
MLCLRSESVYRWTQPLDVPRAGVPQGAEHSGLVSERKRIFDLWNAGDNVSNAAIDSFGLSHRRNSGAVTSH